MLRLRPSEHPILARVLTIATSGLFLLTLVAPVGNAEAQLFVLQGEQGPQGPQGPQGEPGPAGDSALSCEGTTCTLDRDLVVEGDITAERGTFGLLEVEELTVTVSFWLPECPSGYERDAGREDIVLCTNGPDEMVKVGDFWVDRYEASVWASPDCAGTRYGDMASWASVEGTFPYHGSFSSPLYACSVAGVTPSGRLTWFQAQSACAASGKRLLTNAEWQAAVAGTVDPGESLANEGACLTGPGPTGPRSTSRAGGAPGGEGSCISAWGVEDMIGNLWEWVEDWYGQGGDSDDGHQPTEYFGDGYWNIDAAEYGGLQGGHFPAAGLRGGYWGLGTEAGAFAVTLYHAPSSWNNGDLGFRCGRSR